MASGIGERTKLVLEMITLVAAMDTRVIEDLESAAAAHSSCIGHVESVAAYFGILPWLYDIEPAEYLKWIQVLRFVCHPDKHGQSIVGVRNATRLFSLVDRCFQLHRSKWVERVTQYIRTQAKRSYRSYVDVSAGTGYVRTQKSTYKSAEMNAEKLRRFREAVFEADILDAESLSVLQQVEDRYRVIEALCAQKYTEKVDEDMSDSSSPEDGPAFTVDGDGTRERVATANACPCRVVNSSKRGDGSALEMKPEEYKLTCSEFYNRQAHLATWVDRLRDPKTGNITYELYPYTIRRPNRLPGRGRTTYVINTRFADETTTRMPPPCLGIISDLDFEADAIHVDALVRCSLYILGSAKEISDGVEPWSMYNFMLTFFERIRFVAIANVDKIDVLALYIDTSIEQARRVLWSIVQMDSVQFPYMLHAMQWAQRTLSVVPEVTEAHLYTDYKYASWIEDICIMIDGTLDSLATQAITANVSVGHLFRLDTNSLAQQLELLIQTTSLRVYYTRMVDKMLLILGKEQHTSGLRRLCHLLSNNRTQLEDVLYLSSFDIQSITGYDIQIDEILLLVEMIFEELLPANAGLGGVFTDFEARES